MDEEQKYFWQDRHGIGAYDFCAGHSQNSDFYIWDVAVRYGAMSDQERQVRFNGARFVWGGCADGVCYSRNPLKAETIEAAKEEFESWYEKYLAGRIEGLRNALASAQKDYDQFQLYKKEA